MNLLEDYVYGVLSIRPQTQWYAIGTVAAKYR